MSAQMHQALEDLRTHSEPPLNPHDRFLTWTRTRPDTP